MKSSKDTEREREGEGEEHPQGKNTNTPWFRMHYSQIKSHAELKQGWAKLTHMYIS